MVTIKMSINIVFLLILVASAESNPFYRRRPRCGKNEKMVKCASPCGPTCQTPHPNPDVLCSRVCQTCICIDGYIRDDFSEKCVELDKCTSIHSLSQ